MVQQGFTDPIGFSAARRAGDQPDLLHDERLRSSSRPKKTGVGMGIILIMAAQTMLVTESSVQVSNAKQCGSLPLPIDVAGIFDKACGLNAVLLRLFEQEQWHCLWAGPRCSVIGSPR